MPLEIQPGQPDGKVIATAVASAVNTLGELGGAIDAGIGAQLAAPAAVLGALHQVLAENIQSRIDPQLTLTINYQASIDVAQSAAVAAAEEIKAVAASDASIDSLALGIPAGIAPAPKSPDALAAANTALGSTACRSPTLDDAATAAPAEPEQTVIPSQLPKDKVEAEEITTQGIKSESSRAVFKSPVQHGCESDYYANIVGKILSTQLNISSAFTEGTAAVLGESVEAAVSNSGIGAILAGIIGSFAKFVGNMGQNASAQFTKGVKGSGCDTPQFGSVVGAEALLGLIDHWLTKPPSQVTKPLEYARNTLCPVEFPSTSEAIAAWLADEITPELLAAWLAQNNKCKAPFDSVIRAARSKPVPIELVDMRLRGLITETVFEQKMRQLGYTEPTDIDLIYKLSKEIPPPSELTRMMVRDVADQAIVDKFRLDDSFGDKYTGFLKEWSNQQGIDDDYMRAIWRAHWVLPGPGQLYSMYQRNRHFEVGDEKRVELSDIETALRQNDVLPFWIPKLIAISFRPMGRIDIRRAYTVGAMPFNDLVPAYAQLGYNDEDCERLAKFTDKARNDAIFNSLPIRFFKAATITYDEAFNQLIELNYDLDIVNKALKIASQSYHNSPPVRQYASQRISRETAEKRLQDQGIEATMYKPWLDDAAASFKGHSAVKQFKAGIITRPAAELALNADGIPAALQKKWLDDIAAELKAKAVFKCAKFLVQRFLHGEFGALQLQTQLVASGVPIAHAIPLVAEAQCHQAARGKDPPTAQLCEWYSAGLLGAADFLRRLAQLGWGHDDAMRIIERCAQKQSAIHANKAKAAAKDQMAQAMKSERASARAKAAVTADMTRRQRSAKLARAAIARRDRLLLNAAGRLSPKIGSDLATAADLVRLARLEVEKTTALTLDDVIAVIVKASEDKTVENAQTWQASIDEFAKAAVAFDEIEADSASKAIS
jgi:hypothetical protein